MHFNLQFLIETVTRMNASERANSDDVSDLYED
jgi:hypothetical protein